MYASVNRKASSGDFVSGVDPLAPSLNFILSLTFPVEISHASNYCCTRELPHHFFTFMRLYVSELGTRTRETRVILLEQPHNNEQLAYHVTVKSNYLHRHCSASNAIIIMCLVLLVVRFLTSNLFEYTLTSLASPAMWHWGTCPPRLTAS